MPAIAAIKTGTDPVVPLPVAAFHRTLEEPIYCPKCEATYNLVVDYDWAVSRHFETNGVVVVGHRPEAQQELPAMPRRVM